MSKKYKATDAATWEERYTKAAGNQAKLFKRFGNWYDALYAIVGVTPSPWRSKVYIPVLARQTWALVSKFLAIKPGFQVRVNSSDVGEDDVDTQSEKAQRKLEYDYENPYLDESMRDKLFAPLLDAVVTGTGMAKVSWEVRNIDRYQRIPKKDGTWDLTKEKKVTKKVSYNNLEPINIFNVFVSSSAKNLYNAPWIIIKEIKTLSELKEINASKGVEVYKNLDELSGTTSTDDDSSAYNKSRNRLLNQTDSLDSSVDLVKLFECYEGDTICTYAEGNTKDSDQSWILLREQPNPYWHGKYPLVKFHVKAKPFQFWGEGLFETTYRLQAAYNDMFNHFSDQWNLAENSMLIAPERANINDYVVEPGGVISYHGDIAPQQFKHAMPDAGALQTVLGLMDQAIEGVTISQYAAGNPTSATDKTQGTAAGIEHLQQAAGDIVSFFRNNFTQTITQIGRMWLSNNQQFMEEPLKLTITNKGQKTPMTINPADMQGDLELTVDDTTMDPANRDHRIARFMAYTQQLEMMRQASYQQSMSTKGATSPLYIDYTKLLDDYSQVMDHPNYDKMILNSKEIQQTMQNSQTSMITPNERINLDINQLYGSEAAQLLQHNGIQPDPQRASQQPVADGVQAQQTGPGGEGGLPQGYDQATPAIKAQMETQSGYTPDPSHPIHHAAMLNQLEQANQDQPVQADPTVLNMAQELADQGHLDPALIDMLHQPTGPSEKPKPKKGKQ